MSASVVPNVLEPGRQILTQPSHNFSWDKYYQNDLDNDEDEDDEDDYGDDEGDEDHNQPPDPSELESWFDDVGAPAKTLAFLTSSSFPLSPNYTPSSPGPDADRSKPEAEVDVGSRTSPSAPTVLDLGTGNGSALFALRLEGHYPGLMVGVDYSAQSIELARRLRAQFEAAAPQPRSRSLADVDFEVLDLIHDTPEEQPWWPAPRSTGTGTAAAGGGGFDLVLDKGTFDAISLSSATVVDPATNNTERRICELYPSKVLAMVRPGGFLLVTSCNWTEEEVVSWFTGASAAAEGEGDAAAARFEVYDTIKYPVFEFGGQKGQGVASVCFRKVLGR